jgi:hypothetical protein
MLSWLVGNIDANAAFVLVAFFAMITITGGLFIAHRRSRLEINNDFELAKIKRADAHEEVMFEKETERGFKLKQIEQNLITSHTREDG